MCLEIMLPPTFFFWWKAENGSCFTDQLGKRKENKSRKQILRKANTQKIVSVPEMNNNFNEKTDIYETIVPIWNLWYCSLF